MPLYSIVCSVITFATIYLYLKQMKVKGRDVCINAKNSLLLWDTDNFQSHTERRDSKVQTDNTPTCTRK